MDFDEIIIVNKLLLLFSLSSVTLMMCGNMLVNHNKVSAHIRWDLWGPMLSCSVQYIVRIKHKTKNINIDSLALIKPLF